MKSKGEDDVMVTDPGEIKKKLERSFNNFLRMAPSNDMETVRKNTYDILTSRLLCHLDTELYKDNLR